MDIEYGIEIVDEKLFEMFLRTPLFRRPNIEDDPNLRNNFRRFFRVSRNSLKLDKQVLDKRKIYETLLKQSSDLIDYELNDYELNFNTQFKGTNIYVVEFQPRRDLASRLISLSSDKNRENIGDITFYFAKMNNLGQLIKLTEHNFNLFNLEITGNKYSDQTLHDLMTLKKLPKDNLFRYYNPRIRMKKVKLKFKIPIREVVPSTVQKANPLVSLHSMEDMGLYDRNDDLASGGKKKYRTKTKTKTKTTRRPTKTRKRKRKRNTKRR
jgi:hypothetical protein